MPTSGVEERAAFADAMALIGALIGAAVGLFVLFGSRDPAMAFHGLLFVVAGVLAAIFVLKISFQSAGAGRRARRLHGRPHQGCDHRRRVLGHRRLRRRRRHRLAVGLSRTQPRPAVDQLRPAAAAAHLGRDLRLRRQRAAGDLVLRRAAHVPCASCRPLGALVRDLGLSALHRYCRHRLSARHHARQGVRRARMVRRSVADDRVGRLSAGVPRHAGAAQGAAHLRRQLVLSRLHRHRRHAAHRQQRDGARQPDEPQELHRLLRACRMR